MTTPDLAALRALVEAVGTTLPRAPRLAHAEDCGCDDPHHRRGWDSERLIELTEWRTSLGPLWIAALEAMDRMKGDSAALHADETGHLHRCLYLLSTEPPRWSCVRGCMVQRVEKANARLARLEEALTSHQCSAGATWCGKHRRFHGYLCDALEGRNAPIPPKEK